MVAKKKSQKKTSQKKQDSSEHNFSKYVDWKKVLPVLLILFVVSFAFYIRSGPITLSGIDERVEEGVYQNVQQMITQQVNQEYPNINEAYRQELVQEEFQKVLNQGYIDIQGQRLVLEDYVEQQRVTTKAQFQADNGQTYLNAIDPYLFYNYATDIVENGHQGDELKEDEDGNLTPFASYRLAPEGRFVGEPNFHTWLEAKLMELNGVTPDSDVGESIGAIFILSALVAALSAIPCYLILRRFTDDFFAVLGTLLMVSVGTFVSRTVAGFVDTDAYVVFFPLAIVALLLYGFFYRNLLVTSLLAVLAGLFQGFFMWAWGNGWFIFLFSIIALLGYIGYQTTIYLISKDLKKKELKDKVINTSTTLGAYLLSSIVFTFIITGTNIISRTYESIFKAVDKIASVSTTNIWPNVFSSVAELNPASLSDIFQATGGEYVFILALFGLVLLTLDFKALNETQEKIKKIVAVASLFYFIVIVFGGLFVGLTANSPLLFLILLFLPVGIALILSLLNHNSDSKIFLSILLSIWIAGTVYMSFNGVRFILLLTPAFAIAFGISLYYIAQILNSYFAKEFKISKGFKQKIGGIVVVGILFLVFFMPMFQTAQSISKGTTPNFDDNWFNVMENIQENSSQDAIITSWWDFGHFFAATSQRGVTFDGGSQTTPQSHWVGKLLMESDEQVSQDILQMLTCGGNQAHDTMLSYTDGEARDAVKVNKIIYETLGEDIETTREIVANNQYYSYSEEEVDNIMQYLACEEPRENLLITSGDMVGKGGVWAHWGSWDFSKKYVHDTYEDKSAQEIAQDIDENVTTIETYIEELNQIDIRSRADSVSRSELVNQWFAPYPGYAGSTNCQTQDTTIVCQNGVQIDGQTGEVLNQDQLQGASFNSVVIPSSNNQLEIIPQDGTQFDLVLIPSGEDQFQAIFAQAPLGTSLFTKLYYLGGHGTTLFEKFDEVQTLTADRVSVWRVNWNDTQEESTTIDLSDISFE